MEVRNSAAESQTSDQSQQIHEIDDELNIVGGPPDVVAPSGGGAGLEAELGNGDGGADLVKKKRGRPPRVQAKSPPVKMIKEEDEDVCFICFDGGSLVLCDRRGCPKAYHPACVKRDEAFFQSKAKWTCGWHICSVCQKAAHHMCYTCTYSLCKVCIKKANYVCVRGDKGFCNVCMKTIMLIENDGQEKDEKAQVDFDDKTSWEYLFKVYWVYLKGKLSLTLDDLKQAKNPSKIATTTTTTTIVTPSTFVDNGVNDLNLEASESKRRKTDEKAIIPPKETVITKKPVINESSRVVASKDWATKELLDFVSHMKNGDTSVLSQFDVQELMLEYIKRNNLRDPRKKSQIICDSRLKILFGKPLVGHFEMLKLLEFHFFIKEDVPKNTINGLSKQVDPDWNIDNMATVSKDKKRKNHKKIEERAPQNNLDEFAAINVHNMNLIYLRRKFMENLIEDSEEFKKKVVGSIVRIRISGSDQKHDMYRLVQVVGTNKADKPYKIGDKSADFVLEVLNLDKKENVSVDTISNQDLSEDECRRLRQSIRCGLVKRFTVGEIQDKAVSLQSARINDLMEAERFRLNNLRDRASEKGHKKGLREYVEKLQLLKTPEERERRLREIPEVHSDPKMSPDYETDDTEEYFNKEHEEQTKPKYSGVSRKNTISPKKRTDISIKVSSRSWKNEESSSTKAMRKINIKKDPHGSSSSGRPDYNGSTVTNRNHNNSSETSTSSYSMKNNPISSDSETEKVWHYRDPSGKIQGPFCMIQLQKWSTTGYFPHDMRIWTNREDESLLLNDVLKEQLNNKTATEKSGTHEKEKLSDTHGSTGLTVQIRKSNESNMPEIATENVGIHEKLSDTHGSTGLTVQIGKSNESSMPEMASPTPAETRNDIKNAPSVFNISNTDFEDLPSPTPKEDEKMQKVSETMVQETKNVGGARVPETGNEWSGYSPTHVVTTTAAIEPPVSQPEFNIMPPWDGGVRETIEFSTLAEESVSDLLAEVDAMESQNGFPSPTSRRNNFVEDLFSGSFEDFSPTPDRSNPFSSGFQPPTTTAASITATVGTSQDLPSKWPDEGERVQIDEKPVQIRPENNACETSHDREGESAQPATTKPNDPSPELVVEVKTEHREAGGETVQSAKVVKPPLQQPLPPPQQPLPPPQPPLPLPQPPQQQLPPPLSLAIGLDTVHPRQGTMNNYGRPGQEIMTRVNPHSNMARPVNVGWDPHQRVYGGERYNNNNSISNPRSYKMEDSGYSRNGISWVRQSSFGSGGGVGGGSGFIRPPPNGKRVCKFYESGRCKKGASCNYWHP